MEFIRRKIEAIINGRDPVKRLDRAEIERRADAIAGELHTTRADAFARLDRGELSGTRAEPELQMLRDMLEPAR